MKTEIITIKENSSNTPWEGCINSVNYRIERGVPIEVPHAVAELIRNSERERRSSEARLSAFTSVDGLKLC